MRRRSTALLTSIALLATGGGAAAGAATPRTRVYIGAQALHPAVRVVTVLPGERVELRAGPRATAPQDLAAGAFAVVVRVPDPATLLWVAQAGRIEPRRARGNAQAVAPVAPGAYRLRLTRTQSAPPRPSMDAPPQVLAEIMMLVLTPFAAKHGDILSGYRIGSYPHELGLTPPRAAPAYAPIRGFVALTLETQAAVVSAHFRLADFVCKQQPEHFPKFVALDVLLLDKLERLVDRLAATGRLRRQLTVMSGYRTPEYNASIGNETAWSRHTFGDAADVFVDDDGDGIMDDLDGDGATTHRDAEILLGVVDELDRDGAVPGGAAAYPATGAHGPFVHLDARGYRARW